ncbi:MAG TPA: RNA polymerase sigma factor [Xanthobacteraceae bacterium]|nr:RNA polymerase sigma factor [Xanthobacteraceae bacterium]
MNGPADRNLNEGVATAGTAAAEPDEGVLIERARHGDERAIRSLIARHNQRLFRVARAVVRNDAEAEDIVQETYVRAFTRLDSFRGEARLSTWLTRIALNEALGRLRKQRPHASLDELDTLSAEDKPLAVAAGFTNPIETPETETVRNQTRGMLEDVVDRLPDLFRIVLVLRDIEGLSTEETAEQLSIRAETVKTRLHRARKLVRAEIEERTKAGFADLFPFAGSRCAEVANRVLERLNTPVGKRH